jgi:hypothetical protein
MALSAAAGAALASWALRLERRSRPRRTALRHQSTASTANPQSSQLMLSLDLHPKRVFIEGCMLSRKTDKVRTHITSRCTSLSES